MALRSTADYAAYAPSPGEVTFLVGWLGATGHYTAGPTTEWTPELEDALRRWQQERGIGSSGRIDQATRGEIQKDLGFVSGTQMSDVDKQVVARYGPGMAALLTDSELAPILRQAAQEQWDETLLAGRIQQTDWYKRRTQAQRSWEDQNLNDPEQANQRRREREAKLWDTASSMGLQVDARMVRNLAEDSLSNGWSDNQTVDVLTSFATYDPANPDGTGSIAVDISRLKDYARRYIVDLDDKRAHELALRIARGETTVEAQIAAFRSQAKAKFSYGGMQELIDQGVTPEDYFANHRAILAKELEISPEAIDWFDPKWREVLGTDADGKIRPMTETEALRFARRQDEWDTTASANAMAASFALNLKETFEGVR